MRNVFIYGAGGHGKVALYSLDLRNWNVVGFVDDSRRGIYGTHRIYSKTEISDLNAHAFHVAIGTNSSRRKIQTELERSNLEPLTIVHLCAHRYPGSLVGVGSLLLPNCVVGPDAILGDGCILNHNAIVDHDCVIGSFSHIAPGAILGGAVKIGDNCFIGAGAIILPGLVVGDSVTVGAGAVVTRDIPSGTTVSGAPARQHKRLV